MNTNLYPDNWKEISLAIRNRDRWICQHCGKHCYKPGEKPEHLQRSEWSANVLQTHHLDYNRSNNQKSNLISLCAPCHLAIHSKGYSTVTKGQLSLF